MGRLNVQVGMGGSSHTMDQSKPLVDQIQCGSVV